MDMSDIDILWSVLLFLWIVYVWETYLSLRQVIVVVVLLMMSRRTRFQHSEIIHSGIHAI